MMVMPRAVDRLLNEVIPAAADYDKAEKALSEASAADPSPSSWNQRPEKLGVGLLNLRWLSRG